MKSPYWSCLACLSVSVLVLVSCDSQFLLRNNQPLNYLALGDSYTFGQAVDPTERWSNQLSNRLVENDFEVVRSEIVAQSGWTTGDLLSALESADLDGYNLVSLLIGVNNQFQNLPFDEFQVEFDSLLNISVGIAGGRDRVFVLSIPDYGVTPFGSNVCVQISEDIDRYNDYIEQRCMEDRILFINVTEISRQLGDGPGALAKDELHPSGSQYGKWVDEILPKVIELLE